MEELEKLTDGLVPYGKCCGVKYNDKILIHPHFYYDGKYHQEGSDSICKGPCLALTYYYNYLDDYLDKEKKGWIKDLLESGFPRRKEK